MYAYAHRCGNLLELVATRDFNLAWKWRWQSVAVSVSTPDEGWLFDEPLDLDQCCVSVLFFGWAVLLAESRVDCFDRAGNLHPLLKQAHERGELG